MNKIKLLALALVVLATGIVLNSCEAEQIAVQEQYDFSITHTPAIDEIEKGETTSITFTITSEGNYKDDYYMISFIQQAGTGVFYLEDGTILEQAETNYLLPSMEFTLYYTSSSLVDQLFDITIEDSFSQTHSASFDIKYEETTRGR